MASGAPEHREHLREDATCVATIMVDYYGLPRGGDKT